MLITNNLDTAGRFNLGKQGLWSRRRWRGDNSSELPILLDHPASVKKDQYRFTFASASIL